MPNYELETTERLIKLEQSITRAIYSARVICDYELVASLEAEIAKIEKVMIFRAEELLAR